MAAADDMVREVAAAQFAGGMSIAQVAAQWDRDAAWVEEAVRRALLMTIPRRDGGLKATRAEMRSERQWIEQAADGAQAELEW